MADPVQTAGSTSDRVKVIVAFVACVAGVVGYYFLADRSAPLRIAVLVLGVVVGGVVAWFSNAGRNFVVFAQESAREVRKVVWPERKDSLRMTGIVFGFAVVMALFLWGADRALEFVLYDLILGWKQ
ncbi:MAG: preprotein translocase subunit SecE [Burkholderiaceae bacterium]|jgi:preprotein translocase subunit SecE|nr:preprotein translocase subunit SecE [Burkholderiaceae bacterium]